MISDTEILLQIRAKKTIGWNNLYNKYAAMMYGFILQITNEKAIAEEILFQSFVALKLDIDSLKMSKSLCIGLLVHTHANALNVLKKNTLHSKNSYPLSALLLKFCTDKTQK
jgi:hypothetical protein